MIFYRISFGPYVKERYDEAENLIVDYLMALIRNGQIDHNYDLMPWQGQIVAYVNVLGLKADRRAYHSDRGKESLKKVREFMGQMPVWTCNEDFPPKRNATWKNASFLYMLALRYEPELHVCQGDDGLAIPYFTLPLTDREKDDIYCWGRQYRELDALWFASGELEIPAYKILAEPDSRLSLEGRECCEAIEKATGIPTYYYLMRYHGRKVEDERKRRCPGCGKSWYVKQPGNAPFWKFDFQCHKCRLVSSFGVDLNLRYAKIGEPRTPSRQS